MPGNKEIGNPENRPITATRIGSRWTRFWWAWLVVVIAILWVFGWGWFGSGTAGWWGATHTTRTAIAGPGTAVLNSANRSSFVGSQFRVTNVTVKNKVNDYAYWITTPNSEPLLVVTSLQQLPNATINKGEHVNVTGVVQKAPSEGEAQQKWGLSPDDAKPVEQQGAYIVASEVQPSASRG
jgi:hypothetical protein